MRTVKPPEERRQEIIATATKLFLADGYDNTSMNDVMTVSYTHLTLPTN